ncbi:LemA family protein [Pseudoroseomonas cervicalis]|uniref:LemA family protein n=1 Tax=Pseudoroseomonas cervicalis ATCC 49957 TaxID=525371 RepID=D5RSL5_9PROT|nr:LemA family protein [Pseudoroseomonas cervicalis]EFH09695.1 LemA family protein [Pseudoroseomonas cervicalis ATCC 49957]
MGWTILVVLTVLGLAVAYVIAVYNRLVASRQRVAEAWSGIDVQLKRRADLVPNLVATVQGYAGHERGLLEEVTRQRARIAETPAGDIEGRARAEGQMGAMIGRVLAVAEAYPDLKASANFRELQASLEALERDIQHARRYHNGAVRMLNTQVQSFPSNLVARRFAFTEARYFEPESPQDRALPQVAF